MSDGFLKRWSRLKSESKEDAPAKPTAEEAAPPAPAAEEPPPPELPPVDSLTKDSDFSAFLQTGVPEELRRAALSKLWASDPMFTQPEVFDLHMEDYNAHPLGEVVRTAYRVGKGIVEELAEASEHVNFPDSQENSQTKTTPDKGETPES